MVLIYEVFLMHVVMWKLLFTLLSFPAEQTNLYSVL